MSIPANWKSRFFILWSGQAVSLLGSALVQFALVWWLTQKTHSATVLALATLSAMLPQVLLGPLAGVWVDRGNRRLIMLAADGLVALFTLGLAALFALGRAEVWHVYLAMALRSAAGAFHFPAMQSSTSLMVPREQLGRVAGLNQTLNGVLNIAAPPLGALLIGVLPLPGVLLIDAGTALFGMLPLLFIAVPQPPRAAAAAGQPPSSFWGDFRAGLDYVRGWPGLMLILGMALVINFLLSPASALMPLLVTQHFQGGALQLASLESVFGLGMLAGGLLLSLWGGFKRRMLTSMMGLVGIGLGFLLAGLTPANAFSFALAAFGLAAAMTPLTNGPLLAVVQAAVKPEMQGRVFTLIGSLAAAMSPLGLLIAGPVSDALGVRAWYVLGGTVCAMMGVAGYFIPAIMRLEDQPPALETAA